MFIEKMLSNFYFKKQSLYDKKSLSLYPLVLFVIMTEINASQYGVCFSGVIFPIFLFFIFAILEGKKFTFSTSHFLTVLFWVFAAYATITSKLIEPQSNILTFLAFCLFFIASTSISYNKSELNVLLISYVIVALVTSLNIIWNSINEFSYGWGRYSLYIFDIYRDPNYVSAFIVPALGILFYKILLCKTSSILKLLLCILIFITILAGCFFTGSRTPFVLIGAFVLMTLFYSIVANRNFITLIKSITIIVCLFCVWNIFKDIIPENIILRLTNFDVYMDNVRILLWHTGLQLFWSYPLLGAGMGSLTIYLFKHGLFHSHNVYLDIFIGQGLLGIILLGLMFIKFVYVKKPDVAFMFILLVCFFGPLFFINGFNTASFWTPMILCQILSNYSRQNKNGIHKVIEQI